MLKRHVGILLAASGLVLASWATAATAADYFTLSSSSFKDGGMLQKRNAGQRAENPNCLGENISPPLAWSNPPSGTKSYALTMVDPEARGGEGLVHWVAYGISVEVTGFAEGETSKPSPKFVGGKGGNGLAIYQGPCTGPVAPHHYTFTLIATDLDAKELPPGLTRDQLMEKLNPPAPAPSHVKGVTGLIGLWTKLAAGGN